MNLNIFDEFQSVIHIILIIAQNVSLFPALAVFEHPFAVWYDRMLRAHLTFLLSPETS